MSERRKAFTHRRFYTQKLLHRGAFTHRSLATDQHCYIAKILVLLQVSTFDHHSVRKGCIWRLRVYSFCSSASISCEKVALEVSKSGFYMSCFTPVPHFARNGRPSHQKAAFYHITIHECTSDTCDLRKGLLARQIRISPHVCTPDVHHLCRNQFLAAPAASGENWEGLDKYEFCRGSDTSRSPRS